MDYAELGGRGIPIGSGIVKAVNRIHVGERLKKSGRRWGVEGGHAVLTLRSLVKSRRFDSAWERGSWWKLKGEKPTMTIGKNMIWQGAA